VRALSHSGCCCWAWPTRLCCGQVFYRLLNIYYGSHPYHHHRVTCTVKCMKFCFCAISNSSKHIFQYLSCCATFVSAWSIVCISVERAYVVNKPFGLVNVYLFMEENYFYGILHIEGKQWIIHCCLLKDENFVCRENACRLYPRLKHKFKKCAH
jgi:hypothetical protein